MTPPQVLQADFLTFTRSNLCRIRRRLMERDAALFVALAGGGGCPVAIVQEIHDLQIELTEWQQRYQDGLMWQEIEAAGRDAVEEVERILGDEETTN